MNLINLIKSWNQDKIQQLLETEDNLNETKKVLKLALQRIENLTKILEDYELTPEDEPINYYMTLTSQED
jgi:hypothetical protein